MANPKVPNTISNTQMKKLKDKAEKAAPPMFSPKAIQQRKTSDLQRSKRSAS